MWTYALLLAPIASAATPDCLNGGGTTPEWPVVPALSVESGDRLGVFLEPTQDPRWTRCEIELGLEVEGWVTPKRGPATRHAARTLVDHFELDAGEGWNWTWDLQPASSREVLRDQALLLPPGFRGRVMLQADTACRGEDGGWTAKPLRATAFVACDNTACKESDGLSTVNTTLPSEPGFDPSTGRFEPLRVTPAAEGSTLEGGDDLARWAWTRRLRMDVLATDEALSDDPATLSPDLELDPVYTRLARGIAHPGDPDWDGSWNVVPPLRATAQPIEAYPADVLPEAASGSRLGQPATAERVRFDATLIPQNGTEDK